MVVDEADSFGYFEDYMGQTLEIGLTGKSLPRQPIPESMLFLEPADK